MPLKIVLFLVVLFQETKFENQFSDCFIAISVQYAKP